MVSRHILNSLFKFSFSGVIGSGVCVFSRYPIIDAFTYRYSLNGYMYNITHGDWFGGKAAGYCLIDHPRQPIHFFSTHVSHITYYLLTESEVITGKSQTESLMY